MKRTFILLMLFFSLFAKGVWAQEPNAIIEITSVDDWNTFCTALNNGHDYSGETVSLANDITISTIAGGDNAVFRGIFDGCGHAITLNFGSSSSYTGQKCAPFYHIGGATIKNLVINGSIYSTQQNNASLVHKVESESTNYITNCISNVSIHSNRSGDCTNGGFVALVNNSNCTVNFEGCAFRGELIGSSTTNWGGFVGWREYRNNQYNTVNFTNCLFDATTVDISYSSTSGTKSCTFCRSRDNTMNGVSYTNCYYTTILQESEGGKQTHTITGDEGITVANAGTATPYTTSGITGYGTGIMFNSVLYAGEGEQLSLNLSGSVTGYQVDYGSLSGDSNPYTLTMTANNSVISAIPIIYPAPTNLSVSNITPNSAVLSWTSEASNFNIDVNGTVTAITENPYTLSNLAPNTTYEVKVQGSCGEMNSNSEWSDAVNFTTLVACPTPANLAVSNLTPTTAQLSWTGYSDSYTVQKRIENSDTTYSFKVSLDGWTTIDADGDGYNWSLFTWEELDKFVYSSSWLGETGALNPDNYLVSPEKAAYSQITFQARAGDTYDYQEHFGVAVSTGSNTNVSDFTTLQEWTLESNGTWDEYTVDLSAYADQDIWVAIRHFNCTNQYQLQVDNITLKSSSWEEVATNITEEGYIINGLTAETNYNVRIKGGCGETETEWSETLSFTTPPACPAPTEFTVSEITGHTAKLTWTGESDSYDVMAGAAQRSLLKSYDFEDNAISTDFTNDGEYSWTVTATNKHNGTYSVMGEAKYNNAISDLTLNVNLTNPATISFWALVFSNNDFIYGCFLIDGTQKMKTSSTSNNSWIQYTYDLAAGSHTLVWRLAKKELHRANDYFYVDDITIEDFSAASWTNYNTDQLSYTLTGLNPETKYQVKVKSNCTGETGHETNAVNFTTLAACPVPTNLTASNITSTTADLSWTGYSDSYNIRYRTAAIMNTPLFSEDFSDNIDDWTLPSCDVNTGLNSGAFRFFWNSNPPQYLISPEITGITEDAILEFTYYNYTASNPETFQVGLSSADYDPESFTWSETITASDAQEHTYHATVPAGTKYMAIKLLSNDQYYLYIDDIVIASIIPAGEWQSTTSTTSPKQLTGLNYGTEYEVQVQGDCGVDGLSDWSETLCLSTTPFVKEITAYSGDGGYYLIASPLNSAVNPADVTNMLTNSFDLYAFDQAQNAQEWRNYEAATFNLEPGKGYLYANSANVTLSFSGTPYAGDGKVTLSKTEGTTFSGWNLIGNPFNETAYINHSFYAMHADGTELIGPGATTNPIEPMEGVFVIADTDGETVTFTTEAPAKGSSLALNVTQNQGKVIDRALVRFGDDRGLPKFQLRETSTKIYIPQDGKDYAVVSAGQVGELPVNFKAEHNGSYTMSFTNEEVSFSYLHLIDNLTGNDVDLLETPSYTFNARTTDYESRFRLMFATGSSNEGDSFGFVNGMGNLCIFGIEGEATIQVVDILGHVLSSETFSGSYEAKLDLTPGVYMIRLINGNDVKTQKIVLE